MMHIALPKAERVRQVLDYQPDTGVFTWKVRLTNVSRVGSIAGCTNPKGYVNISLDGKTISAARLAWLYVTGEDPGSMEIDHINRVRSDNRFINLRLATRKQNNENIGVPRNNTTGTRGVHFASGRNRWEAYIYHNRRRRHIGYFKSKDEAIAARRASELICFTHIAGIGTSATKGQP
jgi:hypothetical protein